MEKLDKDHFFKNQSTYTNKAAGKKQLVSWSSWRSENCNIQQNHDVNHSFLYQKKGKLPSLPTSVPEDARSFRVATLSLPTGTLQDEGSTVELTLKKGSNSRA